MVHEYEGDAETHTTDLNKKCPARATNTDEACKSNGTRRIYMYSVASFAQKGKED
jgi:hypothetical protein